jgi:hypothetical protein
MQTRIKPEDMPASDKPRLRAAFAVCFWNWKAAALSAGGRAPIFLAATLSHGWHAAAEASLLEAAYRAATAGFFAALTEALLQMRPRWLALTTVLAVIPAVSLWLDYLLHLRMGTPNLGIGIAISFLISTITSLFNWHSMRQGTLIIGRGRRTFRSDLQAMPKLILDFVLGPPAWVWRGTRRLLWGLSRS